MYVCKNEASGKFICKIITADNRSEQKNIISENDREMDYRATAAVQSAIDKAKICKKPIAKYDPVTKRAYVEYANGEKKSMFNKKADGVGSCRTKWFRKKVQLHVTLKKVGEYTNADDVVAATGMDNAKAAKIC